MPGSPYTDLDRPPLNGAGLRRALLVPDGLWTRVDLRTETDSTNVDAVAAAKGGEPEGLVVVAEGQRAGRGRLGRAWISPARAGILTSVMLRPGEPAPARGWAAVPPARYAWLPLLAGVAVADAVRRVGKVDAVLKWPNDVLVPIGGGNGRAAHAGGSGDGRSGGMRAGADGGGLGKCGGILAEAVAANGEPSAVVIGIGLNVTTRADELPTDAGGLPATSLRLAGAAAADRDPLLRAVLRAAAAWYERWRAAGGDADACGLRTAYLDWSATVGGAVRVRLPGGAEVSGDATGVDADGRLLVRAPDGEHAVAAGDVVHVR